MKSVFAYTICVFVGILFVASIYVQPIESAGRPTWAPTDWIQLTSGANNEMSPSWSPEGSEIVYWASAAPGSGGDRDIWIMNSDGTNQRQLTDLGITEHPD